MRSKDGLIIDLFAGGGGASVGIEMALGRQADIAVNHDPKAILMYRTNHPHTTCLTEDIFDVDLEKYVKGRHVAFMWASPDCTSHSKAKGGKPKERGLRVLPWAVYKHAKAILPDVIMMENVEEIRKWGPLDENGYPIKEKEGQEYLKFIEAMRTLGYDFDCRDLVAADYGAPTTRKRWFAIFRRDGLPIVWPKATHNKNGDNGLQKWEPIWKYLDLTDVGKSIFGRKKPLAENTMNRIARGMKKFVFESPEPFIMKCYGGGYTGAGTSIHKPLDTITTVDHNALVTPHIAQFKFSNNGQELDKPLHTVCSVNHFSLISPYMVKVNHGGEGFRGQGVEEPLSTITTKNGVGTITPYIMQLGHTGFSSDRNRSVSDPMSTVVTKNEHCLISPFLIQYHSETTKDSVRGQDMEEPIMTIDTSNRYAMVLSYLTKFYRTGSGQSLSEPIHTITTSPGHFGQISIYAIPVLDLHGANGETGDSEEMKEIVQKCTWVSQFLIKYYGVGTGQSIHSPIGTITPKDKFALVTVLGDEYIIMDIFLRMLKAESELKLGQGFPDDYVITKDYKGNKYPAKEQVARIGNSVVPIMSKKLVEANCSYLGYGRRIPICRLDRMNTDEQGQLKFA